MKLKLFFGAFLALSKSVEQKRLDVDVMAAKKSEDEDKKTDTTRLQVIGLMVLLLGLMSTSVVTALMAVGVINVSSDGSVPVDTITDAQLVCDKAIVAEHGDSLQTYTIDDFSSRADENEGGFQLFYELNIYRDASHKSGVNKFYVNCFVSAKGRIRRMDLHEDKVFIPKAIRRTHGNAFGI